MEPMLEGMSALSHDGDPVHASKRIEIHEMMDSVTRMLGLSGVQKGEIYLDLFLYTCIEEICPYTDDIDGTVLRIKDSIYASVDSQLRDA